jgi:hypothetical protein
MAYVIHFLQHGIYLKQMAVPYKNALEKQLCCNDGPVGRHRTKPIGIEVWTASPYPTVLRLHVK